jgi:hypothetical protein
MAAPLGLSRSGALSLMTANERKTDGNGHSSPNENSDGDGQEKPGLVIEVVLPEKKPDERDLGKKH